MRALRIQFWAFVILFGAGRTKSFSPWNKARQILQVPNFVGPTSSSIPLFMAKKRGGLGELKSLSTGSTKSASKSASKRRKRNTPSKSGKNSSEDGNVSPALAAWASKSGGTSTTQEQPITPSGITDSASSFTVFEADDDDNRKKSKSNKRDYNSKRRQRQTEVQARAQAVTEGMQVYVDELLEALEKEKAELNDILDPIRSMLSVSSTSLTSTDLYNEARTMTAGTKRIDYRLAWVGSDNAVCHVGTSLHKVPLARLQEVFLSLLGRSRIQLVEVIRVLGPFPNIKNTLEGSSKIQRLAGDMDSAFTTPAVNWKVTWESMLDGTGKELLAGKEENQRLVDLQLYVCSPSVVIGLVPPDKNGETEANILREDPLESDGKNVLVFVREDEYDERLEVLRVAPVSL